MDILGKLFGSPARVKIIRIFLLNPEKVFEISDIRSINKIPRYIIARELSCLSSACFIKKKNITKSFSKKIRKKTAIRRKRVCGWVLDDRFPYLVVLRSLLLNSESLGCHTIVKRFRRTGKVKLIIVSGVFIQSSESCLDILVVGDSLKKGPITRTLRRIEAEVGKELRYGVFDTSEFLYRIDVYDRFVRDVLDYPHKKLLNKLGIK